MAWPPPGLTLRWFGEAFENSAIPQAFMTSILAATGATAIAIVLGTLAAMAVQRYSFFGRETVSLLILPIALPGVVTGIALSSTFQTFGVEFGLMTIVVATPRSASSSPTTTSSPASGGCREPPRTHRPTWAPTRGSRSAASPCPGCGARCIRRAAGVRPVVRRGHRHGLHRRRRHADDPARCSPRCSGRRSCRS